MSQFSTPMAPTPGPQRTAERLAELLFCIAGSLAKHRHTGGHLSAQDVRTLVERLDRAAAEAERMGREIGELTDMILDLAGEEPAQEIARLRPALTVIPGGKLN